MITNTTVSETVLSQLLSLADKFAVQNVKLGRGGPFGASLHVHDRSTNKVINIGSPFGNAVLSSGLATAHAEDQAMQPNRIRELKTVLRSVGKDNATVILVSSGESCGACHAKEEILARHLITEGLLDHGNFIVPFGATYQMTKEVAGFDDLPYHLDMQKPIGEGIIKIIKGTENKGIQRAFNNGTKPFVCISYQFHGVVFSQSLDCRTSNDLFATPEVKAINNACEYLFEKQVFQPWKIRGARLYSTTPSEHLGPLAYTTMQWANVTHYIHVPNEKAGISLETHESPGISNRDLFKAVATRPYNGPGTAITVIHLPDGFENLAQKEWAEKIEREGTGQLYNGASADPALEK